MEHQEKVYVEAYTHLRRFSERFYVGQQRSILAIYQLGSRYAGYDIETSDYDYMVVYMPSPYDLIKPVIVHKLVAEVDGMELEIKFMSIAEYVHRIEEGDLEALQMLNAYDHQRVFCKDDLGVDTKQTRLVDYMKELEENREAFTYLEPEKLFRGINGRIKATYARMENSISQGEAEKAVKCAVLVHYFMDVLKVLAYNDPIREGLVLGEFTAESYRYARDNIGTELSNQKLIGASNLMEVNRAVLLNMIEEYALPKSAVGRYKDQYLTGRLLDVLLGGYYG
nr:MAG TPA: RNA repair pathway protein [Herelleviridae sp.]